MEPRTLILWIVATALGESLGLLSSAVFGAVAAEALGSAMTPALSRGLVVFGGIIEGACLGAVQGWALQKTRLGPAPGRWFLASTMGMGIAWGVASMLGESLTGWFPAFPPVATIGLVLGTIIGTTVGLVQAAALHTTHRPLPWVLSSALAWSVGLVVSGAGGAAIPPGDWAFVHFLLLAGAGFASGACVGALSAAGWAFPKHAAGPS